MIKRIKNLVLLVPIVFVATIISAQIAMAATTITVNSTDDTIEGNPIDDGRCTIREALYLIYSGTEYGNTPGECKLGATPSAPYTVDVPAGTYKIPNGYLQIRFSDSVTIQGAGIGKTIIDGENTWRIFDINSQFDNVYIKGMTLQNGNVPLGVCGMHCGGAIFNKIQTGKKLSLTDVEIKNSETLDGLGGAIHSQNGDLSLLRVTLDGNKAKYGGGIYFNSSGMTSVLDLQNVTIKNNESSVHGGGVYQFGGRLFLDSYSRIQNNKSGEYGGGLYLIKDSNDNIDSIIRLSEISGNTLTGSSNAPSSQGGGISFVGGTSTIDKVVIKGNTAERGGGISSEDTALTIQSSSILDNAATTSSFNTNPNSGMGGGLFVSSANINSSVNVYATTITNNSVDNTSNGGGIAIRDNGGNSTVKLINNTIVDNKNGVLTSQFANLTSGTLSIKNSLLIATTTTGKACFGTITDAGSNVQNPGDDCLDNLGGSSIGDFDPFINPLTFVRDNYLYPLTSISAVLDMGLPDTEYLFDQRSFSRDSNSLDIGSYEYLSNTVSEDLAISSSSTSTFTDGQQVIYTIEVSNTGTNYVGNIPVSQTLPVNLTSATWTCQITTGTGICPDNASGAINENLSLYANSVATFTLTATLSATAGTNISLTTSIGVPQDYTDPVMANNTATTTKTVPYAPLVIQNTSPLTAVTVNTAYSQTLTVTGGSGTVSWSVSSGTLPTGLSLNSTTGIISGTPSLDSTFNFDIKVDDTIASLSQTKSFSITVNPSVLTLLTTSPLPAGTDGTAYSQTLSAGGGTAPFTFSLDSGTLPAGITLTPAGSLSGTPTMPGTYNFTVKVTDSVSATATKVLALTINQIPLAQTSVSPLDQGNTNIAYTKTLQAEGGIKPYTWSLNSGTLPTGITLNSVTGTLSGTPTATGTSNFNIKVTDSEGVPVSVTKDYSITIAVPPLSITNIDPLPAATIATAYSQTIGVTSGLPPYNLSVKSGTLPAGITLNAGTGMLSGTPTAIGTSTFEITVTDMMLATNSKTFHLTVNPTALSISTVSPLTTGTTGHAYSQTIATTGGIAPYTYTITAGALPAGLSLTNATGVISGTPTSSGTYSFTVTSTDSQPATVNKVYSLTINAQSSGGGGGGGGGGGSSYQYSKTTSSSTTSSSTTQVTTQETDISRELYFTDTENHWASDYIQELHKTCQVNGYTDSNGQPLKLFKPDLNITRAELITLVIKCKYGVLTSPANTGFTDISETHWAAPYIAKAKELGITNGYKDGTFKPDNKATREETLKIVLLTWLTNEQIKAAPINSTCADINQTSWAAPYFNYALNKGIISGYKDANGNPTGRCQPTTNITRAESSKIIITTKK